MLIEDTFHILSLSSFQVIMSIFLDVLPQLPKPVQFAQKIVLVQGHFLVPLFYGVKIRT